MPVCACLGSSSGKKKEAPSSGPKKKVYITRSIHYEAVNILKERYQVEVWQSENKVPREKLLNDVKGVNAVICTVADQIDEEILAAAGPSLKLIGSMTSGLSHIDEEACAAKGVALHHVASLCADVNAETTCALLMMVCKRLMEGKDAVKNGEWRLWKPMWILGVDMAGKTLGILGFGQVGLGVAKRLKEFELERIIYFDKNEHPEASDVCAQHVTLEEVFSESDFIICCLALTKETKEIINAKTLSLCKPGCYLVNTARAELVNQDDLLAALTEGKLAGVGLDVTTPEPLPPTHPLLQLPNCVVLPHMGTATHATRRRMAVHLANIVVESLG